MEWIKENYEWLFGGLGVAVLGWLGAFLLSRFKKSKAQQTQSSGKNSNSVQAGRDAHVDINSKD